MEPLEWIALAMFAMQLIESGIGMYQDKKINQRQEAFAKQQQEDAQAHEELMQQNQMQYNSFPNQVAMMKEAGLNPALLYGGSASLTQASSTGSGATAPLPTYRNPLDRKPTEQASNLALNILLGKSQIAQADAQSKKALAEVDSAITQAQKNRSDIRLNDLFALKQKIENAREFNNLQYNDVNNQLDILGKQAGISNVNSQTRKNLTASELDEMQSKYTQTQINLASLEYTKNKKIWDECADYIVKGIKAENDGKTAESYKMYYEAKQTAKKYGLYERTSIDPEGGPFGANSIIAPILDEVGYQWTKRNNEVAEVANRIQSKLHEILGIEAPKRSIFKIQEYGR